jgi:protein-S-isoprenylcysteine O-methyltransferase Ste14
MYYFLIPLYLGFAFNLASVFTAAYSLRWGKRAGTLITFALRNILGIPVWATGFVMAVNEPAGSFFHVSLPLQVTGWLIITTGVVLIIVALVFIRIKASAPAVGNSLVRTGIYSRVRHPIYSGTILQFIGIFVLWPSVCVGIASVSGLVWIYLLSVFEERDLVIRIPEYRDYMKEVPRFIPGSGLSDINCE